MEGRSTAFIKNYLSNHSIQVRINVIQTQRVIVGNWVPQSGVTSITCFILAINGIVNTIPKLIKCRLFANDLNISLSTSDVTVAETLIQATLLNRQTWSDTVGLQFSPKKCKFMLSTQKRKFEYQNLYLHNAKLSFVTKHTFLRVTFDPKITWSVHLKGIKYRAFTKLAPSKWWETDTLGLHSPRCWTYTAHCSALSSTTAV